MLQTLLQHYNDGGFFMHVILFTSFVGLALVFDRARVLLSAGQVKKDELLNHVNSALLQGSLEKALLVTSQMKSPLTDILRAGLQSVANNGGPAEVQTAMDAIALREMPKLERRLSLLPVLASAVILVGLLGALVSIIPAFAAPSELMAPALSGAMNCTAFGLIVAILLIIAHGLLLSRAQEIHDDIFEASVATLNFILINKEKLKGA